MEKRRFSRIMIEGEVEMRSGEFIWRSRLVDLSLKGALIECPIQFIPSISAKLHVKIMLPSKQQGIEFDGTICHIENNNLGIRCDKMDIFSVSELRKLLELNLGNEALLNRELHALTQSGTR